MTSWREFYSGGFLKAADLPSKGRTVKIKDIAEQVIRKGEDPKLVAALKGGDRWVLNATNCELLEEILSSADPHDWGGKTVELYNDRSVRGPNGEKGGIRVRESSASTSESRRKAAESDEDDDDLDDDD